MTHHDKAPELVERLKVVARCGTDSTMRHSAYAFMAQDPDGDYVTYSAYVALAEENQRLREALRPFAAAEEWREIEQAHQPRLTDGYTAVRISKPGFWLVKGPALAAMEASPCPAAGGAESL